MDTIKTIWKIFVGIFAVLGFILTSCFAFFVYDEGITGFKNYAKLIFKLGDEGVSLGEFSEAVLVNDSK